MNKEEAATNYADNVYRNAGCSPNTDGHWRTHKDDFLSGFSAGNKAGFQRAIDTLEARDIDDMSQDNQWGYLDAVKFLKEALKDE